MRYLSGLILVLAFGVLPAFAAETAPQVMCTMEAKICPDGTGVGRTGPNCEFAPCPDAEASEEKTEPAAVPPNVQEGEPGDSTVDDSGEE